MKLTIIDDFLKCPQNSYYMLTEIIFATFDIAYLLVFTCHKSLKFMTFKAICHSCSHKKSGVRINKVTEKLHNRLTESTETEPEENIHSTESEEDNAKVC